MPIDHKIMLTLLRLIVEHGHTWLMQAKLLGLGNVIGWEYFIQILAQILTSLMKMYQVNRDYRCIKSIYYLKNLNSLSIMCVSQYTLSRYITQISRLDMFLGEKLTAMPKTFQFAIDWINVVNLRVYYLLL